ncbi:hypothetical protein DB35_16835, partial [Streptomyces abyssalis]
MHIRPYVDLPEPEDAGSQTPDLEPFARCGQGETAELPVLRRFDGPYEDEPYEDEPYGDLSDGSFDAPYGGPYGGPVEREPGAPAAPLASAASDSRGGSHRRRKGRGAYAYGQDEAAGKRRRPAKAALAAVGAVAALGAGLLTTQALTGGGSGDDRSLSTDDTALPDPPSGGPTEEPSRTDEGKRDKKPSAKQTARTGSGSPRADRDGGDRGERAPAPSRTSPSSSSAPGTPGAPGYDGDRGNGWGWGGGGNHDGDRDRPRPPQEPTQPGGETLRPGDSGPEVAELQRRLKQA